MSAKRTVSAPVPKRSNGLQQPVPQVCWPTFDEAEQLRSMWCQHVAMTQHHLHEVIGNACSAPLVAIVFVGRDQHAANQPG